jgi:exodeoxyribonuclease VII small subunit
MSEMKFEQAIEKLESVIADLESGGLGLDESLKRYEEGIKLANFCSQKLESAQKKVEVLLKKGDNFKLEAFDEESKEERPKRKKKK